MTLNITHNFLNAKYKFLSNFDSSFFDLLLFFTFLGQPLYYSRGAASAFCHFSPFCSYFDTLADVKKIEHKFFSRFQGYIRMRGARYSAYSFDWRPCPRSGMQWRVYEGIRRIPSVFLNGAPYTLFFQESL